MHAGNQCMKEYSVETLIHKSRYVSCWRKYTSLVIHMYVNLCIENYICII